MSDLLKEAIVEAKQIRDMAQKNAQLFLQEKYAEELNKHVSLFLEQEGFNDLMNPLKGGDQNSLNEIPPAYSDGEKLCQCPKEDETIEVDLDQLMKMSDDQNLSAPSPNDMQSVGDLASDIGSSPAGIPPAGASGRKGDGQGSRGEEELDLPPLKEEKKNDDDEEEVTMEEWANPRPTPDSALEEEDTDMEIDESLLEELVVDTDEERSGYFNTPEPERKEKEELRLAKAQDTKQKEEIKNLLNAVSNLKEEIGKHKDTIYKMNESIKRTNLLNAQLYYSNKALLSNSLNERQKQEIVEQILSSKNIEEAKMMFETLDKTMGATGRRRSEKTSAPKSLSEIVEGISNIHSLSLNENNSVKESEENLMFAKMKKLAGIKTGGNK